MQKNKLLGKRKRCPHCEESLTVPVYKKHKDLFYDIKNGKRMHKVKPNCASDLDYEDDVMISGSQTAITYDHLRDM